MDFRILGSIEVWSEGQSLPLGGERQRALLAYLVLHVNEVIAGRRLLDELWEESPGGGLAALQTQVSRLRRVLGDRIVTTGAGYSIHVEPGELDLDRFRSLLAEAGVSADPAERSAKLREANALWRGIPLAGVDAPFALGEIAALEELRLAALEDRIDADLDLGRHRELVSELSSVVTRHPFRERLRGQLILSLYRSDRQADALEAYRQARRTLDEELGLEPGPTLRELERSILQHDPALDYRPPRKAEPRPRSLSRRRLRTPIVLTALVGLASATVVAVAMTTGGGHAIRSASLAKWIGRGSPEPKGVTISDTFNNDYVDPTIWHKVTTDRNVTIAQHYGLLVLTVGASAAPGGTYNQIDVHVGTQCQFPGNFDARVDYALLEWPSGDDVFVGLNAIYANSAVGREFRADSGDQYNGWVVPNDGAVSVADNSGSLRIARANGVETTYFWHEGAWRKLAVGVSRATAVFGLQAMSAHPNDPFGHQQVKVAFDNFSVTGVHPSCPDGVQSNG